MFSSPTVMGGCGWTMPTDINLLFSGLPMEHCVLAVASPYLPVSLLLFFFTVNALPTNGNELHQLETSPFSLVTASCRVRRDDHKDIIEDGRSFVPNDVSSFALSLPTFFDRTLWFFFTKDLRPLVPMTLSFCVCVWADLSPPLLPVYYVPRGHFSLFDSLFSHLELRSVKRKLLPIKAGTRVTGNDLWIKCNTKVQQLRVKEILLGLWKIVSIFTPGCFFFFFF